MAGKILVLDDEERYALMIKELLADNGYGAEVSTHPTQALERLQNEDFSLVVSDYKMPVMDGAQFLKAARRNDPDLPIIIISGLMNMPELLKVANMGVTLVLEKPFDAEDFLLQVARLTGRTEESECRPEAEEVDREREPFDYPAPSRKLADASLENRKFLSDLYGTFLTSRHIFLHGAVDGEFRLLSMEVLLWLKREPMDSIPCVVLEECEGDLFYEWVRDLPDFPPVLIVEVQQAYLDAGIYRKLKELIQGFEEIRDDLEGCRILYALTSRQRLDVHRLQLHSAHGQKVAYCRVPLEPLEDRIEDVAWYLRQGFIERGIGSISDEAADCLLNVSWSQGVDSLNRAVKEIAEAVQPRQQIDLPDVMGWLAQSFPPVRPPGEVGMEAYLRARQMQFIQRHKEKGEDWRTTLLRLGVEKHTAMDFSIELEDQPLFFPELLEADESAG